MRTTIMNTEQVKNYFRHSNEVVNWWNPDNAQAAPIYEEILKTTIPELQLHKDLELVLKEKRENTFQPIISSLYKKTSETANSELKKFFFME